MKLPFRKVLLPALSSYAFGLLLISCAHAQQPVNIALGKNVTFNKRANYGLTADPDDELQLTDGKYSASETASSIWVQKSTVGWNNVLPVIITIDLGSVQPISGVSYSTAAGVASVSWPNAICMATSDDNKTWHYVGDLIELSPKPPASGYHTFRYTTHDLQTKGRYISFAVADVPYTFVDEIEVYKGDDAWLNQPTPGRVITDMTDIAKRALITSKTQRRLNDDIADIRDKINQANLSPGAKSTFIARLNIDATAAANMQQLPIDFKTILPLNNTHRDILAVYGELLAAEGQKPLTVWHQHRYAWLPLLAKPDSSDETQLQFSMLRNQFRSDDLLLTNASATSQNVTLQLKNAPQNTENNWLQIYSVAWTDTAQGTPVADALLPVDAKNGVYKIDVPAGMTRKVWFTVDSSKVPAGSYKSTFVISGAGQHVNVPLSATIANMAMGKPRFSLGMWDYTNGDGAYGITPKNRAAAISMMRSHFVDLTWASRAALPQPKAQDFDAHGNFTGKLDFSNFDAWVKMWPGARHYFVYLMVKDTFAGAKINTPEFNVRVGSWAKVLSAHMAKLKLQPEQLGILLVDEPRTDAQDAIIAAWAKAINTTAPELTLFEDPIWDEAKNQDAFSQVDILSPQLPIYNRGGEPVKKYFSDWRKQGKILWLYQCTGPVRSYSPQQYYRYQPWQAFAIGATGEGFWAFGDTSGAPTSWNEYLSRGFGFAPAFLDTDTVYNSVHWDAVREGIEDYEELAMLQDRIKTSNDGAWKSRAQDVLNNAVAVITSSWTGNYNWQDAKDPDLADEKLQLVRNMLQEK